MLNTSISANYTQKSMSPLSKKLGTQIASEDITIIDDGIVQSGWQTRPFDDEGHPTQKTPIIEKGILRNYVYDTYTALQDGVESTGNARRLNYSMAPEPALSNLILEPGRMSPEEIIHESKNGIYVEDTIGEWLSDPVSGSLSATVTHGYLVENGKLTQPIKGVVISGNFYEILKGGIEILGNDLRNSMQCYSPTVKLTQLSIAGEEKSPSTHNT
jgi:predicted Zn-dependent protease